MTIPDPQPQPVLMRPSEGETREEFTERFIAALRASGFPIKDSDDE